MADTSSSEYVEVKGRFRKEIWSNTEQYRISAYTFESSDSPVPAHVQSEREFVAKGAMLPKNDLVIVKFTGRWMKNKGRDGYSLEVKPGGFVELPPASKDGIIKYLASGLYKGIGRKTAESIYRAFGANSIEIVTRQTYRLREIKGIGPSTVNNIIESVKATVELQDLVLFLAQYDIGLGKIKKIQNAFPNDTLMVIQEEPFRLCEIHGFGFSTVDAIAEKLGTPLGSPLRIKAAVESVLKQNNSSGHLYMYEKRHQEPASNSKANGMIESALELLNSRASPEDMVSEEAVRAELQIMEFDKKIVIERDCAGNNIVYRWQDYEDERYTAARLTSILREPLDYRRIFNPKTLDAKIAQAEKKFELKLADKQVEAVKTALTKKVCVITGGPGTGKTTILRVLLHLYKQNVENNYKEDVPGVLLLSTTGKAARRMSESANEPAYTIHKGLGIKPGEAGDNYGDEAEGYLTDDIGIVFVDESSMTDMSIMAKLVRRVPQHAQFVCIGDIDQLPSVGPGAVLKDMINSSIIPVVRLDIIYRQGETSLIVKNAHKIISGDTQIETSMSQFAFFPTPFTKRPSLKNLPSSVPVDPRGDEIAQEDMIGKYLRAARKYGLRETQILCPRRDKVVGSADEVNKRIQALVFGNRPDVPRLTANGRLYHEGERIIQTKNTESASNGDMGIIRSIRKNPEQEGAYIAAIQFDFMDDGTTVDYYTEDFDNVQLGYAITVHRSQGSEYKAVFIPVLWSQVHMLRRNLLYTAVTRGKEIVCLFGQSLAIRRAINVEDTNTRNTLLGYRLKEMYYGTGNAA